MMTVILTRDARSNSGKTYDFSVLSKIGMAVLNGYFNSTINELNIQEYGIS